MENHNNNFFVMWRVIKQCLLMREESFGGPDHLLKNKGTKHKFLLWTVVVRQTDKFDS